MNKHLLFPFNFKLSFLEYWDISVFSEHLYKVITTDKCQNQETEILMYWKPIHFESHSSVLRETLEVSENSDLHHWEF